MAGDQAFPVAVGEVPPAPAENQAKSADPFDGMATGLPKSQVPPADAPIAKTDPFAGSDPSTDLQKNVAQGQQIDPQTARQVAATSRASGQDPAMVARSQAGNETAPTGPAPADLAYIQKNYPKTASYLAFNPLAAAGARDDIGNLLKGEKIDQSHTLSAFVTKNIFGQVAAGAASEEHDLNQPALSALADWVDRAVPKPLSALAGGLLEGTEIGLKGLSEIPYFETQLLEMPRNLALAHGFDKAADLLNPAPLMPFAPWLATAQETDREGYPQFTAPSWMKDNAVTRALDQTTMLVHSDYVDQNISDNIQKWKYQGDQGALVSAGVIGALRIAPMIPQMGFALAAGPGAPLLMGAMAGAESQVENENTNVSQSAATTDAGLKALANGFFFSQGAMKLFGGWADVMGKAGAQDLFKAVGSQILKSQGIMVAQNTLQGLAEDLIDKATGVNPSAMDGWLGKAGARAEQGLFAGTIFSIPGVTEGALRSAIKPKATLEAEAQEAVAAVKGEPTPGKEAEKPAPNEKTGQKEGAPAVMPKKPEPRPELEIPTLAKTGVRDLIADSKTADLHKNTYLSREQAFLESKIKKDDPVGNRQIIEHQLEGEPHQTVYFPAEDLTTLYQGMGKDPAEEMNKMGLGDAYEDAVQTGGDISVGFDKWLAAQAGTPEYKALADHMKLSLDGRTVSQVEDAKVRRADIDEHMAGVLDSTAKTLEKRFQEAAAEREASKTQTVGLKALVGRLADKLKKAKPSGAIKDVKDQALYTARQFHILAEMAAKSPEEVPMWFDRIVNDHKIGYTSESKAGPEGAREAGLMTPLELMKKSGYRLLIERPNEAALTGGAKADAVARWRKQVADAKSQGVPYVTRSDARGALSAADLAEKFHQAGKEGFIPRGAISEEATKGVMEEGEAKPDANHDQILEEIRAGERVKRAPVLSQGPLLEGENYPVNPQAKVEANLRQMFKNSRNKLPDETFEDWLKRTSRKTEKRVDEDKEPEPQTPEEIAKNKAHADQATRDKEAWEKDGHEAFFKAWHAEAEGMEAPTDLGDWIQKELEKAFTGESYFDNHGNERKVEVEEKTNGTDRSQIQDQSGPLQERVFPGRDGPGADSQVQTREGSGRSAESTTGNPKPGNGLATERAGQFVDPVFGVDPKDVVEFFQSKLPEDEVNYSHVQEPQQQNLFDQKLKVGKSVVSAKKAEKLVGDMVAKGPIPGEERFDNTTKLVTSSLKDVAITKVTSPHEAAVAGAYLAKGAQERMDALITDKNGKPLALVGGFKGGVDSTQISIHVLTSEAFRVDGAAHAWLIHNHPGGTGELSDQDKILNRRLTSVLAGSGVEPMGMLAIGAKLDRMPQEFGYDPPDIERHTKTKSDMAKALPENELKRQPVPPVEGSNKIPAVEREMVKQSGKIVIGSPEDAEKLTKEIAGDQPGIMFLDHRNNFTGFTPVQPKDVEVLRQKNKMDALYKSISMSNPSGAIIVNAGKMTPDQIQNLSGFLKNAEINVHDVLEGSKSWRREGQLYGGNQFKQGEGARGERGSMRMAGNPNGMLFETWLNKRSDESTLFHEDFHRFVYQMHDLSERYNNQNLKDRLKVFYKWVSDQTGNKVEKWEDLKEKHHELGARGYEYRIWEGNIPGKGMRRIFDKFTEWLRRVYPSVEYMRHYFGGEVTPEMRDFYDRMLATSSEIAEARSKSGYDPAVPPELPEEVKRPLVRLEEDANGEAQNQVLQKNFRELTALGKREMEKHEVLAREVARRDVDQMPVFSASDELEAQEIDPKSEAAKINEGMGGIPDKVYTAFEKLAIKHGFNDFAALAKAIVETPIKDDLVNQKAEQFMARFTPLKDTPGIKEAAMAAIHNDKALEAIALRNEVLKNPTKAQTPGGQPPALKRAQEEAAYAKQKAKLILDNTDWKKARDPRTFVTQEEKAMVKAALAADHGDAKKAEAYRAQRLVNSALAGQATKNLREAAKIQEKLLPFIKRKDDLMKMKKGFTAQIDKLLENAGMKDKDIFADNSAAMMALASEMHGTAISNGEAPDLEKIANETGMVDDGKNGWRPEKLLEFVERHDKEGWQLQDNVSPEILGGTETGSNLTMSQLRELKDAVMAIAHVGLKFDKGNSNHYKQAISECATLAAQAFVENVGTKYAVENRAAGEIYKGPWVDTPNKNLNLMQSDARALLSKALRLPDRLIKSNVFLETLCKFADGAEDGPLHRYLFWPLRDAAGHEIQLHMAKFDALQDLMKEHYGHFENFVKKMVERHDVTLGGIRQTLTREKLNNLFRLAGSVEGHQRLLDGFKASPEEIQGAINKVDPKDVKFILARAKLDEEQWPKILKNEMDYAGVELKRAEFKPIEYRGEVVSEGMYHRLKYDTKKSNEAFRQAAVNEAKSATDTNPSTPRGYTKRRVPRVNRPPRLDDGVYTENQEEVIHDLAYRGVVQDLNRLLKNRELQKSMADAVGTAGARMPGDQLRYMASSPVDPKNLAEKFWDFGRVTTLTGTIGIRPFAGIVKYLTDNYRWVEEVGPKRYAKALWEFNFIPGRGKEITSFVDSIDPEMKVSDQNFNADVAGFARQWDSPVQGKLGMFVYLCERIADQRVRKPFYYEVYKNALAEHGDEEIAKNIAGQIVDRKLGSGNALYHNQWQRGNVYVRSMAAALSYNFMLFNDWWRRSKVAGLEYDKGNIGKATFIAATAFVSCVIVPAAIYQGTKELTRNPIGQVNAEDRKKRIRDKLAEAPFEGLPPFNSMSRMGIEMAERQSDWKDTALHLTPVEGAYTDMALGAGYGIMGMFGRHLNKKEQEEMVIGLGRFIALPDWPQMVAFNFLDDMHGRGHLNINDLIQRKTMR